MSKSAQATSQATSRSWTPSPSVDKEACSLMPICHTLRARRCGSKRWRLLLPVFRTTLILGWQTRYDSLDRNSSEQHVAIKSLCLPKAAA